jgi:hypothetical protein
MITTTSNPSTDSFPGDAPRGRPAPRKPSRGAKVIIVALIACVTAAVLALAGVFDSSASSGINIDPVTSTASGSPSTTAAVVDRRAVTEYVAKLKAWSECVQKHPGENYIAPCGEMPAQVDTPSLNAYLAAVLDWNKCASPLLKRGATTEAEAACGPQPAPPTGG